MDERELIMDHWKRKITGIQWEPQIDYKLIFCEALKSLADQKYSLLDIGTGTGRVIFENGLDKLYRKVVGVDIRPEMIEICREKSRGMKNAEFHVMDSTKQTGFQAGSFDVVSAMFPPFDAKEMYRLLNRGGYFILLSSLKGDHKEVVSRFPDMDQVAAGKYSFGTVKSLNTALRNAGFKIVLSNIMRYLWLFRDEEVLKQFYEKITFTKVFDGREQRLAGLTRNIDGRIPVTRFLCTTIARKA